MQSRPRILIVYIRPLMESWLLRSVVFGPRIFVCLHSLVLVCLHALITIISMLLMDLIMVHLEPFIISVRWCCHCTKRFLKYSKTIQELQRSRKTIEAEASGTAVNFVLRLPPFPSLCGCEHSCHIFRIQTRCAGCQRPAIGEANQRRMRPTLVQCLGGCFTHFPITATGVDALGPAKSSTGSLSHHGKYCLAVYQ